MISPTSFCAARAPPSRRPEGVAEVFTVDGALEIPATMAILLDRAEAAGTPYDAAVALGCVIRGETGHYEIVAGEKVRER